MQKELLENMYRQSELDDLLKESDYTVRRRKECQQMVESLSRASEIVSQWGVVIEGDIGDGGGGCWVEMCMVGLGRPGLVLSQRGHGSVLCLCLSISWCV
ncbi:hypothetical protein VTJ49DRAFT_3433 [Mycothermus thermophilus]|uniref:GED domain-containing protein n=1 Tax=Humicola insolens TaxID=85995 RepID=A0ABR3V7L5_HUMIN